MKSNLKKLAALLLTAVLVLSLFPTTSFAANGIKKEKLTQDNSLGYIHTEIPGGHYLTDAYLRGEAIAVDAPRGPVLVTYSHIPLGWANNLGNRANNLYPKGLRIVSKSSPDHAPSVVGTQPQSAL